MVNSDHMNSTSERLSAMARTAPDFRMSENIDDSLLSGILSDQETLKSFLELFEDPGHKKKVEDFIVKLKVLKSNPRHKFSESDLYVIRDARQKAVDDVEILNQLQAEAKVRLENDQSALDEELSHSNTEIREYKNIISFLDVIEYNLFPRPEIYLSLIIDSIESKVASTSDVQSLQLVAIDSELGVLPDILQEQLQKISNSTQQEDLDRAGYINKTLRRIEAIKEKQRSKIFDLWKGNFENTSSIKNLKILIEDFDKYSTTIGNIERAIDALEKIKEHVEKFNIPTIINQEAGEVREHYSRDAQNLIDGLNLKKFEILTSGIKTILKEINELTKSEAEKKGKGYLISLKEKLESLEAEAKLKGVDTSSLNIPVSIQKIEEFIEFLNQPDPTELESKLSVENFFKERQVPLREEGESLEQYLAKIHRRFLEIATSTVWNKVYDQSEDPYSTPQSEDPLAGPTKEMKLLDHTQVYTQQQSHKIRTFGALFDQLHLYFPPEERKQSQEFAERLKKLFNEISIWHNRAVVRRKNHDPAGPDGEFKSYQEIASSPGKHTPDFTALFNREKMTKEERAFSRAVEFCMGVWAAMSLKKHEVERIRKHMSADVRGFLENKYRGAVPSWRSNRNTSFALVEDMIDMAERIIRREEGLPENSALSEHSRKKAAELAYHVGESFRISSGIETQLDVTYTERGAKVAAVEGGSKILNLGLYVESAWLNEVRPEFNKVFADYMVHGYAPFSRALQFTHTYKDSEGNLFDISGLGDFRASIAELLAVDNAVETIDWSSNSTTPDKGVLAAANQAIQAMWSRAAIAKAMKPENSFFISPKEIPLATTQILDRPQEINQLTQLFGYSGQALRKVTEAVRRMTPVKISVNDYELFGFDSDSTPITAETSENIRQMYKNFRDYWLAPFTFDVQKHPLDTVRLLRFIFTRDDRDLNNGYVNEKIRNYVENMPANPDDHTQWVKDTLLPKIQGYITFDVIMRSVFYMLQPDFKNTAFVSQSGETYPLSRQLTSKQLETIYKELDFHTFESLVTRTMGGTRLVDATAQLAYVLNQAKLLRRLFPEEHKKLFNAGYRLFHDSPTALKFATNGDRIVDAQAEIGKKYIFSGDDLLRLAQEFGLGEGYRYEKVSLENREGAFWQLRRIPKHPVTKQYIVDRLLLLMYLFDREDLHLRGK